MIKQKGFYTLLFTIILTTVFAQKPVNQFDKNGKRHGIWTKNYYQTDQKRYEGQFVHGKEVDTFKYYTLSEGKSVLSAIRVFNKKDSLADVTFYASTKKIISKGKMNGKRFIGQWVYYHKDADAKMIVENFNDEGKLEGERNVFYKNGQMAEKAFYKNGLLHGEAKWFSEDSTLIKVSHYKDDKLEGKTINYDGSGKVASEGEYVKNKKHGVWKYYEDGEIIKEIDHTNETVRRIKQ